MNHAWNAVKINYSFVNMIISIFHPKLAYFEELDDALLCTEHIEHHL